MKILVPVDGSAHSIEALKVAIEFVKLKGAEVSVISVIPFIGGLEDHEISPSRREKTIASIESVADAAVKEACKILDSENVASPCTKTVFTSVSVSDGIVKFAEKEHIDLIVMGSKGLSASATFTMGSVASQVAKSCPCSIYLVKTPMVS